MTGETTIVSEDTQNNVPVEGEGAAPAEATPTPVEQPQEAPKETPSNEPSLTGKKEEAKASLTDPETHDNKAIAEYDFDKRLYNNDGTFNKDGAKEFFEELKAEREMSNKRIQDMRRMVSTKDEFVKEKEDYIRDFAPKKEYMKFFDEKTPEETKKVMGEIQKGLANIYFDLSLNKSQAYEMSNHILDIMKDLGVLDTRTKDEIYLDKQKWIDSQKEELGANADNIIREVNTFVMNSPAFSATVKENLIGMMESQGAGFVNVLYQLKEAFGSNTGGVPTNVSNLGGLPSDAELAKEYMETTSEVRKEEIIRQRHAAGRKGKLMDALQI